MGDAETGGGVGGRGTAEYLLSLLLAPEARRFAHPSLHTAHAARRPGWAAKGADVYGRRVGNNYDMLMISCPRIDKGELT